MLSVHKILHFIHQKTSQCAISNLLQTIKCAKNALYKFKNKFGIFCRVRTFCAYTQPYDTVNVAKDTVAV